MADFTHLHLHTQYSFLDGAIHMKDLCGRIGELGMDACAMTDHANLFGAIDFYQRARKAGIKPILGCEVNVAPRGRFDRTSARTHHLILLAKNQVGWRNLMYLVSTGYTEGFYYKPRVDKELLREHSEGIIGLSACLGGEIPRAAKDGDMDAARNALHEYKSMFAPDHFFLELQENGMADQTTANNALKQLARDEALPLVATNNCHYIEKEDAAAHDILQCIKDGKSRDDPKRWRRSTNSLWIRSPDDMLEVFSDCPEAVYNTQRIVEMVDLDFDLGKPMLPTFIPPDGSDLETYLREQSRLGLEARIAELPYPIDRDQYFSRLNEELDIIISMKFPGYFLIVADFIIWAKKNYIPVGPGRGSGAGSLVAYALKITDLDPIPYNLLFQRFLNPERVSMPDFDIDFCQERRGEVIDYVREKYGTNNVGQIGTFAQMKAKSVIKDVSRALEVEFSRVNGITRLLPDTYKNEKGSVKPITIDKALELDPDLRTMAESFRAENKDIMGIARRLEGLYRQAGMHAAGVVIADGPLWETVPVFTGKEKELIAQFSMVDVELAGLVKFDFLGLKTLDVVDGAERHVNERIIREIKNKDVKALWKHPHIQKLFESEDKLGEKVHADKVYAWEAALNEEQLEGQIDLTLRSARLSLDDKRVFALIGTGNTIGIFQLESTGFQKLLTKLKPDCFEDIVAAVALYRPGPLQTGMVDDFVDCKHGRKTVTYPHPLLEEVLKPTYGGFVYQEQVMQAAQVMAGYTLGGADLLRRAMGKKKVEVMAAERVKFIDGCAEKNIPKEEAESVFDLMEKFAGYGFNKSHSAAYALITYQTGYLKTLYPVEFLAALMSTELTNTETIVKDIAEARQMGIKVLPPTINQSMISFSVSGDQIRFGLGAIKGLGDAALQAILEAREEKGAFQSLYDFCERVPVKQLSKKTLETLIRSGAFDEFSIPRARLLDAIDRAVGAAKSTQRDIAIGQESLFGSVGLASAVKAKEEYNESIHEWPERERLRYEKEALGFYVTGHPLARYENDMARLTTTNIDKLKELKPNSSVVFGAIVGAYREMPLKDGSGRIAFVTLEDRSGAIEVRVNAKKFAEFEQILKADVPLLVKGSIWFDRNSDPPAVRLRTDEFVAIEEVRKQGAKTVEIRFEESQVDAAKLLILHEIIKEFPGDCNVGLKLIIPDLAEVEFDLPDELRLNASEALVDRVEAVFGRGVVRFA